MYLAESLGKIEASLGKIRKEHSRHREQQVQRRERLWPQWNQSDLNSVECGASEARPVGRIKVMD